MRNIKSLTFILVILFLHGCASQQTMSNYARTGDTVMVSLGGDYVNALVPVVKKQNMSVTITDSAGNIYPVTVRHLFQTKSDLTSKYSLRSLVQGNWDYTRGAYQGLWMAVIDIEDPDTGIKPPLVEGEGFLSFTTAEINASNAGSGNGDISNIAIEILSGIGNKHSLNSYEQFGTTVNPMESLEPAEQIRLVPVNVPTSPNISGARLTIRYTDENFSPAYKPRLVPVSQDPNVQLITSVQSQGDGTTLIEAMVLNIHGIKPSNSHQGLSIGISDLRAIELALVWIGADNTVDDANWQTIVLLESVEFIDINGNVMPGVSYSLDKVN